MTGKKEESGGREDEGSKAPTAHGSSLTYPLPTSIGRQPDDGNVLGMIIELV